MLPRPARYALAFGVSALLAFACGDSGDQSAGPAPTGPSTNASAGSGGDGTAGSGGGMASSGGSGGTSSAGGSGGTSSAGGSAGNGGAGGSAGGGGSGGGGGINAPCMHGGTPCPMGLYCQSTNCGMGTCQPPLPPSAQQKQYAPVCGCDGVSYYNATIAEAFAMATSHSGACTTQEAVACTRMSTPCATGLRCNTEVANNNDCFLSNDPAGFCWGVPIACDPNGPQARGCIGSMCADRCSLIQSGNPWYEDQQCP